MPQLLESYSTLVKDKSGKSGGKIIAGEFSRADVRNENGRLYKFKSWENWLNKPQFKEKLKMRRVLGMLGHPDTVETQLQDVSHIVTYLELRPDGEIYGEAEILDTPSGKVLKVLYDAGVELGVSSRGYLPEGSNLIPEGIDLVVPDDYELITFDFVIDPSSNKAFPKLQEGAAVQLKQILTESKEKLNPDIRLLVEGITSKKNPEFNTGMFSPIPLNEGSSLVHGFVGEDVDKNKLRKEKEALAMVEFDNYNQKLLDIIAELTNRCKISESLLSTMAERNTTSDAILHDISKRYITAEQIITKFTEYAHTLEETVQDISARLSVSEGVIEDLVGRYTLSEQVIKDLRSSGKTSSAATLESLQKSYTLAQDIIAELTSRLKTANNSAVAEATDKLRSQVALSESVIQELTARVSGATPKRTPIPEGYFEGIASKYGVAVSEAVEEFNKCGRVKAAFEHFMEEKKRLISESSKYLDLPYMNKGTGSVAEAGVYDNNDETAKISRLVATQL